MLKYNHDNEELRLDYVNCMHKFMIQTGGLNHIYTKWVENAKHTSKRYRYGFNNTNIY